MVYDLIIVGKGIAACAAAISLSKCRWRIAVIAPEEELDSTLLAERFKIGETLSPAANQALQALDLYEDFLAEGHFKAFSSFSSWGTGELKEKYIWEGKQQAGWYLDRVKFEDFLWKKAQRTSFDYFNEKVRSATYENQTWEVNIKNGTALQAKYVLDCTGRSAVISRNFNQRKRLDNLVAIYAVLNQDKAEVEPTIASLIEPMTNGWFYSSLTPRKQLVVAFFTDSDLIPAGLPGDLAAWKQLLATADYTQQRIESAEFEIKAVPKVTDASTIITTSFQQAALLVAGDTAASFDPLSSHGMTTALWSGQKAALAFLDLMQGSRLAIEGYEKTLQEGIEQYLQEKRSIYHLEKRFSVAPFWERRMA